MKPFQDFSITPTIVWPEGVKLQGGNTSAESWIKDLPSVAPPTRATPSFPTVSPSHQEASTNLLHLSIIGQMRMKTTITEN